MNAIQLVMALVANIILLLNMAKKIRFTIAQPVTIVTWYISSFCLIALTATADGPLEKQPQNQYIWSGAFYYGLYAACLYFVCSSLMVVTFWGAMKGHYSRDFQLTTSQRTLMLQTIMFLIYLLVGALVFSIIEDWAYLDAVYWADVTLFTVGFGDFSAATPLGRALLFPYALIGVISLGLVVGSIRSLVLERGRRQLGARMMEKKRKQMLRRMIKKGQDDILIPVTDDEGDHEYLHGRTTTGLTEFQRRQKEFNLMRKIQSKAEHRRRWMAMLISTTVWLILWLVGAAIFQQCEVTYQGWTYFDGFYFAFVSLTTIGYGDVTPISPAGKSFFVFWSLLALPTMTVLISNAGDTVVKLIREWTDWLGTVTILPGERGFKKEVRVLLRALSMGQVFGDDSDIEESPPGYLGNAGRHDDTETNDDEGMIAEEGDRQRELSTRGLEHEIGDIAGGKQNRLQKEGLVGSGDEGSDTVHGETPSEPGWEKALTNTDTSPSTTGGHASTTPQPTSNSTNHLSFAEPAERRSSTRKTGTSFNLHRAGSVGSSRSGRSRHNSNNGDINSQTVVMTRAFSIPRTAAQLPRSIPTNRYDYIVTLIDEISIVTQHLKSHPPRKYSFEEWAWFLKLVGEDEDRAENHKKPVPKKRRKRSDGKTEGDEGHEQGDEPEKLQWSWVGSRSPLMGSQEEAEWILEKLEKTLAGELRRMRDEALGASTSANTSEKS